MFSRQLNLMCAKLKFRQHLPLPLSKPCFSQFLHLSKWHLHPSVGLVRNLGFILTPFSSLSYCASKSKSYQRDLQNTAGVWACLLPPLLPPWARLLSVRRLQCSPHGPPAFHSVLCGPHPRLSTATRRTALKNMLDHLLALKSFRAPRLTQRLARPLTVISDAAGNGPLLPFTLSPDKVLFPSPLQPLFNQHAKNTLPQTLNSGCSLCLECFSL